MSTLERIQQLMKKANITAATLTKELNLNHSALNNWTSGKAKPSADALAKIADYFDVSVDYLMERTDNPTPSQQGIELPGVYLRLAKEAQELGLDEEDVDHILAIYRRHEKE